MIICVLLGYYLPEWKCYSIKHYGNPHLDPTGKCGGVIIETAGLQNTCYKVLTVDEFALVRRY